MGRCVIVGGAPIADYAEIRPVLGGDDYMIYCDSGLAHCNGLGRGPDLIVGDFDSHPRPETDVETIVLPRVKDDTDTVFAVKEALRRGYDDFLLLGAVGRRLDHTWGNVSILLHLDTLGKTAEVWDDYSELSVVSRVPALIPDRYPYFSLLNVSGLAEGVTIENAKYPLHGAAITCDYPIGVSNEVTPGMTARVTVGRGRLLLVKVRHE
ncbi:MAG: thiamine diphosphokinase [Oscillospiraceae bacterium]|nr:thiamine diphosphokinase [Oscillospiraceae bacterium]